MPVEEVPDDKCRTFHGRQCFAVAAAAGGGDDEGID
jgi:S-adenosylmethionine hydrolase